jgi:hypothetical protein
MKKEIIATLVAVAVIASISLVLSNTTETSVVMLNDTSYISASGYFHVVGEVENNLPANVQFVKINAILETQSEIAFRFKSISREN